MCSKDGGAFQKRGENLRKNRGKNFQEKINSFGQDWGCSLNAKKKREEEGGHGAEGRKQKQGEPVRKKGGAEAGALQRRWIVVAPWKGNGTEREKTRKSAAGLETKCPEGIRSRIGKTTWKRWEY